MDQNGLLLHITPSHAFHAKRSVARANSLPFFRRLVTALGQHSDVLFFSVVLQHFLRSRMMPVFVFLVFRTRFEESMPSRSSRWRACRSLSVEESPKHRRRIELIVVAIVLRANACACFSCVHVALTLACFLLLFVSSTRTRFFDGLADGVSIA